MMLLVWPPVTLFKFAPAGSALINRHCFLFAAHHHSRFGSLINLMPATYVSRLHQTYSYKHRNLFTRFSILTQQSSQVQLTTSYTTAIRYLHRNKLTYSTSLVSSVSHSHHEQQITRHLHALIQPPIQTMNLSSVHVHDGYSAVVKERRISCFKEEWERILEEHEIAEPFWSVKWIVEHVLRKYPHSEVYIVHLSLSLSPSLSHIIRAN